MESFDPGAGGGMGGGNGNDPPNFFGGGFGNGWICANHGSGGCNCGEEFK